MQQKNGKLHFTRSSFPMIYKWLPVRTRLHSQKRQYSRRWKYGTDNRCAKRTRTRIYSSSAAYSELGKGGGENRALMFLCTCTECEGEHEFLSQQRIAPSWSDKAENKPPYQQAYQQASLAASHLQSKSTSKLYKYNGLLRPIAI